ncbi:protoporphyrinogen oxidase [Salinicola sp. MH3R3-1]|uniref:protoporphyrinogen oxidase n=1 Tax=Salinicola sp. MH3R3-1 TaxID=1928762 RepID=UPI00094E1530|nr:protoporphyrinogen oxidase [Salinicola sp. MH3R3-1]OLO09576.1 protoporphyrinogen oxidase [Salinicola sp. MH3R3-1]
MTSHAADSSPATNAAWDDHARDVASRDDAARDDTPLDTLIVGAGATGLAAAWTLAKRGQNVTLLESNDQVGGNLHTERDGEWQIEHGPNTVIMKPPLYALLDELDLLGEAQPANAESTKRFVVLNGQPVALPMKPLDALTSPIIGWRGWARLAREPFIARSTASEETLAAFVSRRLGPRILGRMVDPFVSGVYAGDPARLSVQAAMPRLAAMEQEHRSLIIGGLKKMRQARRDPSPIPVEWRGKLVSFPQGLQRLTDRLAEGITAQPTATIQTGCEIRGIRREGEQWVVEDRNGRQWRARSLVLAVPAPVAAALLRPLDERLAKPLAAIAYPPVNAIALGFREQDIAHPLDGFGVLIPRAEKRRTLGALFSSTLFEGRAPAGHKLLNVFIGGRQSPEAAVGDDATQVSRVIGDLRDLLGIRGEPVWQKVTRWPQAIPQYEVGHLARIEALDDALRAYSGLHLAGNWRGGIAVGDCLENGRLLGEKLLAAEST